jgi:hypothetical protein
MTAPWSEGQDRGDSRAEQTAKQTAEERRQQGREMTGQGLETRTRLETLVCFFSFLLNSTNIIYK